MDNIINLHNNLTQFTYRHGDYQQFNISDPKLRLIHKAQVRDRVLHHAIYRLLYQFFDRSFIADSFSCRLAKGTHKALNRFRSLAYRASQNHTQTIWILKCDIKKFFASIDHLVLKQILSEYISDQRILWLLGRVINSFYSGTVGRGLPLGNLTSQLFCNIYMNKFDQFVKHQLKVKYYLRYADDFVFLSPNRFCLENIIPQVSDFLHNHLKLNLHQDKVFIKTLASGVDWLGWVHFPDHRILRTSTKRRMMRRIQRDVNVHSLSSYLGLLKHGDTYNLQQVITNMVLAKNPSLR